LNSSSECAALIFGGAMSVSQLACSNSAKVMCVGPRGEPACFSKRRWTTLLRAAALGVLFVCFAGGTSVMARGGHGVGGFGMHGGRMGGGGGLLTPVYVMIVVSKITDADGFKSAINELTAPNAAFAGRLAVDVDKPLAWDGTAPSIL
jgi:hypothetical protein